MSAGGPAVLVLAGVDAGVLHAGVLDAGRDLRRAPGDASPAHIDPQGWGGT
ncbi:hypothetical protein [Blastococcus saxobsidens]|uniref:hypothetical protein n=1 Tax=Blastococcus saxobsidens TaxID=138336 RepID=UPI0013152EF1|nr:hypothetical protein [Blastococcus saxobsidens]